MSSQVFKDALHAYNADVESAITRNDGDALCRLLRSTNERTIMAITEFYRSGKPLPEALPPPWHRLPDLVRANFLTAGAIRIQNWDEASRQINHVLRLYLDAFSFDSSWSAPLLLQLCEDARVIAQEADKQLGQRFRKPRFMEQVLELLKDALSIVSNDQRSIEYKSRRIATLTVLNQLLKVYFNTNELSQCSSIVGLTQETTFSFKQFPIEQQVVFKFYEGRLALYNCHYSEAVNSLSDALAHIPVSETTQRRRVLLFLIPAKIMTGLLPSKHTLDVFHMHWFQPIVQAIRSGNVGIFDTALRKHAEFFNHAGIYLTVQKMLRYVYRALIRRLIRFCKSNRIYLYDIRVGLRAAETVTDTQQVDCILANLIHQGIIGGYIAPKLKVLCVTDLVNPVDGTRIKASSLV